MRRARVPPHPRSPTQAASSHLLVVVLGQPPSLQESPPSAHSGFHVARPSSFPICPMPAQRHRHRRVGEALGVFLPVAALSCLTFQRRRLSLLASSFSSPNFLSV